jgi:hypothetical protein
MYNRPQSENNCQVYQVNTQAIIEYFNDGALIILLGTRQVHLLNPSARDVLHFTDGKATADLVARSIAASYEADPNRINPDVHALYKQLLAQGIVELIK